ncbi:MAG TPA: pyridoxamine 5'-phosphate oxidase family protein [Candidatus Methanomethylophilaceae archaeon]|nr:pyridoxamine 5'-phosphate oxidase family protein [Candidatus Methanomethylophilaceae archaeon]
MVAIPNEILDLMKDKGTVKILVTANAAGQPHAIVCGSFGIIGDDVITVGEIFMKRSSEYMAENKKVAILLANGGKAYELQATVIGREGKGTDLDNLNTGLKVANMSAKALWKFKVSAIYNESAGPDGGKKIL